MIYPIFYFLYLLIVWSIYRFLFHQTEIVDEVLVKPVIWLLPLFLVFLPQSRLSLKDLGIKREGLSTALFLSLGLGFVFLLVSLYTNYQKYGHWEFLASAGTDNLWTLILLILATSITEELVFRGYLFSALKQILHSWLAGSLAVLFWVIIHIPVTFFFLNLATADALVYLVLTALYGVGALTVYVVTGNLLAPILIHLMWSIPIILFR